MRTQSMNDWHLMVNLFFETWDVILFSGERIWQRLEIRLFTVEKPKIRE
jgi:hypothetical protein